MSPDTRVLNLTRNCRLKLHQAESRIAAGVAEWVRVGHSIRELSLSEVLVKREHQRIYGASDDHSDFNPVSNEIRGIRWEPPTAEKFCQGDRYKLLRESYKFQQSPENYWLSCGGTSVL
jgi:hypothetical protein